MIPIMIILENAFPFNRNSVPAMKKADGNQLYIDGILRRVSRTDEEWAQIFSPWYTVEQLENFACPGEGKETRRLLEKVYENI